MLSIVEEFDVIYIVYLFLVMVILIVIGYMCFLIINCVDYFYYNMIKEYCENC